MNTEELLKPRYKVIADYPGMQNIGIGNILYCHQSEESGFGKDKYYSLNPHKGYDDTIHLPVNIEPYPHIFKKLEWWEERDVKDLPEYLRSSETYPNPHFIKVTKHYGIFFEGEYYGKNEFKPYWECSYDLYFPSTLEQYNQYTNQYQ